MNAKQLSLIVSRNARWLVGMAFATTILLAWSPAAAQEFADRPPATPEDGPLYPIGALDISYLEDNPLHPPAQEAMQIMVTLGESSTGYVAPRDGFDLVTMTLDEIAARPVETYHASAIQHLLEAVRDYYVAQDLIGVYAAPDPTEINEIGQDLRPRGDTGFTILITTGVVTELRTIASGERVSDKRGIPPDDRIDNTVHRRIIERSPIKPYTDGDPEQADLLRKAELDRFLFFLGRHSGRRVDASVAAAVEPGTVALDYIITENYPLTIYAQVANTGTDATGKWRERFGFFHTQLTNNDDILSLDYTTAGFSDFHNVQAAYESPFPNDYRLRWRVFGGYNEYDAEDIGVFDDKFSGNSWWTGGEIVANVYQNRNFFLDVVGGVRYEDLHVDNETFFVEGDVQYLVPYVGLRLERLAEWYTTTGFLNFEFTNGGWTDVNPADLEAMGRSDPDENWQKLVWGFSQSVFLEPVLNRTAWEDPNTPESSTLAHELLGTFRGQWAFDNRLIPQQEAVAGGLYTVRGYPQSVAAGDTVLLGSLEYRYHVPRAFAINPEPTKVLGGPFRVAPQYVYGVPDWDLILKVFIDAGRVLQSERLSFEQNETLVGTGLGAEIQFKRNLILRVDWGVALESLNSVNIDSGNTELYFVGTVLF